MKTLKTLKLMFKVLDTKKENRPICQMLHCKHENETIISVIATNGHILLKTQILTLNLKQIMGEVPPYQYFGIAPDKLKTAIAITKDDPSRFYKSAERVIPDFDTKVRQTNWTAFDAKYMLLASEFLAHEYGWGKFSLSKPFVDPSMSTLKAHIFTAEGASAFAVIMPLRIED